jgi:ubiquinone/menaquinone biosynthesis C-methylase UbiE
VTERRIPRSRIYDGLFYAKIIDPFVTGLHEIVADVVEPGAKILDVGCGTGNLALRLAPAASEVVGVELSPAMVEYAVRRLDPNTTHVSFVLGDVTEVVKQRPDGHFDIATMVLALHEMPVSARGPVLREVTRVSKQLLCLDYRVPMPWTVRGFRNRAVEALAGREHFGAFRHYTRRGGAEGIAAEAGLVYRNLRHPDRGTFDLSLISRPQ